MNLPKINQAVAEILKLSALGVIPMDLVLRLREQLQGTRTLTHRIRGRIAHPNGVPIPALEVELWDRDLIGDDYLGVAVTDTNGRFEVLYDPAAAGTGDHPDLELRIYDPPAIGMINGQRTIRRQIVETFHSVCDVKTDVVDVGVLLLDYFEYEPTVPFPFSSRSSIRRPFVPAARAVFGASLAKFGPIDAAIQIRIAAGLALSTDEIQAAYPENRTIELERSAPGSTRSDEYFIDRLFNGFHPAKAFRRDPDRPHRYTLGYRFDAFTQNGHLDLPNFSLVVDVREPAPTLMSITLQFRERGHFEASAPLQPACTYTPADGERWTQAKRVFRAFYQGIIGQLQSHVAEAHFNMEQYALGMSRHLRTNPLRALLFPHLKEVININDQGRDLLLGADTGIFPKAKPIVLRDQLVWLEKNLGTYDWADWKPRTPLYSGHRYAHGANLYWAILGEFVDEFFAAEAAGIAAGWSELRAFSDDLVTHAVAHTRERMEDVREDRPFADPNEFDTSARPRSSIDGVVKAIRPVVEHPTPNAGDLANLKQLARYCIFHCTWLHGWFHQEQNNEFGELKYSALLGNGSLAPESDESILPSPDLQSLALRTSNTLQGFTYGYMLANEDGDVDPRLIARLQSQKAAFDAFGCDLGMLRSRLNA